MATPAHQFGAVPLKEGSRWLPNLNWMCHTPEANRAATLLVEACPSQAYKAECNGRCSLYVGRRWRKGGYKQASQIHGSVKSNCRADRDLREQECPKSASSGQ